MSTTCNDPECWCCGDPHRCDPPPSGSIGDNFDCSICGSAWAATQPDSWIAEQHPQVRIMWRKQARPTIPEEMNT